MKGSWSDGSDKMPELSQAENEYAAKLERERTLRHTLVALQENKVAEAKSTAAKLQKKVPVQSHDPRVGCQLTLACRRYSRGLRR